jgi:hypothetical protein
MATFEKHKEASNRFHKEMAESGHQALQDLGQTLKKVGEQLAGEEDEQEPGRILADAVLGVSEAHSAFRERALNAAATAVRTLRSKPKR